MAGSYRHCCDAESGDPGELLAPFRFDLIENMGDAWEACEMMHFMIQHLADGDTGAIADAEAAYYARPSGY